MVELSKIRPEEYVKLFNIKETPLIAYFEVEKRKSLMSDEGFPDVHMIYIKAQHYFKKSDIDRYDLTDDQIDNVLFLVKERSDELVAFSRQIYKKEKIRKSDVSEFFDIFGRFMAVVDIPIYLYPKFEERFYALLKGVSDEDISVLTHPMYNTYHYRRRKDLLSVRSGSLSVDEFISRWEWSEMQLFVRKTVDRGFVAEQLEALKESELFDKMDFLKAYEKLTEQQKALVDIAQKLIEVRDYRIESVLKACFMSMKFLGSYAESLGITYDDLIYMTPEEILEGSIPNDLSLRKVDFAYVDCIITNKDQIDRLYKIFNARQDGSFVEGKGVSKGKVVGRAKIILSKDDLIKVKKGDIIVCDITTPDYMHAIHNAAGIVANIGGFTSHTAIVAREFSIPAVIGCGNATGTFFDGDLIEVDANNGKVRRIE